MIFAADGPFAERVFGEDAIKCALDEFWGWPESDEVGSDPEALERQMPLFLPWATKRRERR